MMLGGFMLCGKWRDLVGMMAIVMRLDGIQFVDALSWMVMGDNRPRRTPSRSSS
jgi:hypothetical protein